MVLPVVNEAQSQQQRIPTAKEKSAGSDRSNGSGGPKDF